MGIIEGARKVGDGLFLGSVKVAKALYDFSVDGGVSGDIVLRGDKVPSGAIVLGAYVDTETALTSGGAATVALKLETAADVNAADAITGAPWSAADVYRADALGDADEGVKTTAERSVTATVATADLTAGAFDVYVLYVETA